VAKFRSGKTGRTTVGAATLSNLEWSTKHRGVMLDTSNFESNGFTDQILGLVGVDISLKANWNAAQSINIDPPGLYPRDDGSNMSLYTSTADNVKWNFPVFACESSDITASATGLVTYTSSCKSSNTFTTPNTSV